jgi:hypothetical protein
MSVYRPSQAVCSAGVARAYGSRFQIRFQIAGPESANSMPPPMRQSNCSAGTGTPTRAPFFPGRPRMERA